MRQEEHGERDDDEVVEEQHPAGAEAGEVVERLAHERGRAARLRDRGDALGVRQGDDDEEQPRQQQHLWRQSERVAGDDAEREVDRRGDLAVRDREQRGRAEDSLQHGQLARHQRLPSPRSQQIEAPGAEPDEQHAEQVADAPSGARGLHEQRDAERDEARPRRRRRRAAGTTRPSWRRRSSRGTARCGARSRPSCRRSRSCACGEAAAARP